LLFRVIIFNTCTVMFTTKFERFEECPSLVTQFNLMAWCITPGTAKVGLNSEPLPFPCGKCPNCLARRASGWSFRLMQEGKTATSAHFLTLTYDDKRVSKEGLSILPRTANGFATLKKRDLQLFFKRLRQGQPISDQAKPIKYYAVGEYGSKTMRPHYHIILFNAVLSTIDPAWQNGAIHYGDVTGASIGYTLKYMSKPPRIPVHRNDDRVREFALMSKGLGIGYMSSEMMHWHHADLENRMYVNLLDGKKASMPRYYKEKIYYPWERKRIAFFAQIKINAETLKQQIALGDQFTFKKVTGDIAAFERMYFKAELFRDKL